MEADFTNLNANKACWDFFSSKQCANLPPSTVSKGKLLGPVVDVISLANVCGKLMGYL